MKIGLDFDNTIVNYDRLFEKIAKKNQLIQSSWAGSKSELRSLIIKKNHGVKKWKKLQGIIYGEYMNRAESNKGIENFLIRAKLLKSNIFIVSHKTKHGHYDKRKTLLRVEALKWLKNNNFFNTNGIGISKSNVFFESSIDKKIARIKKLKLDFFIDDLEIVLKHPNFKFDTTKILFSLLTKFKIGHDISVFNNWRDISYYIFGKESINEIKVWTERIFNKKIAGVKLISGQKNSTMYKIQLKDKSKMVMKYYPDLIVDSRERLKTEFSSLKFLKKNKIYNIPNPIKFNQNLNVAFYSWIDGKKIKTINKNNIKVAINFMKILKSISKNNNFSCKNYASEACLSINEIIRQINIKLETIIQIKNKPNNLNDFINNSLLPIKKIILNNYDSNLIQGIDQNIAKRYMILSPSDFGFHNSLINKKNSIFFHDFEYFGWDDPIKLICDFYWHPGMSIKKQLKKYWLDESIKLFKNDKNFLERLRLSFPLHGFRWALIILNDFTDKGKKILLHKSTIKSSKLKKNENLQIIKSYKICQSLKNQNYYPGSY